MDTNILKFSTAIRIDEITLFLSLCSFQKKFVLFNYSHNASSKYFSLQDSCFIFIDFCLSYNHETYKLFCFYHNNEAFCILTRFFSLLKAIFLMFSFEFCFEVYIIDIMLAQLQQTFSEVGKEVILKAWKNCKENIDETKGALTWLTENTTNLQQQQYLMELFEYFGDKLEKTTISQTWKNCNQIFFDTYKKLEEVCAISDLNELNAYEILKEENEFKILREICLHILWNILKYPKHIKYRQIHKQALYNYLFLKCHTLGADLEKVSVVMEWFLQYFGFKKGNDDNWYYQHHHIQLLHLWKCYRSAINLQKMYFCVFILLLYKTRHWIVRRVCMLWNGKLKDYESLFDYEHRTIMLFDEHKLKIKSLQLGNPKKSSLEFNVSIQWYNDIDIHQTHAKWACLILNHTWHFRTIHPLDRDDLSNCVSVNESKNIREFNSFNVIWKSIDNKTHKEPLNPYSITFKQGIQHVQHNLQMRNHFMFGMDELILFECKFDKCKPAISSKISKMNDSDVLLYDIYKHLPHYPIIQVLWEIKGYFMVPYKRTIGIERKDLPKSNDLGIEFISSNQKTKFNPLLYECDLHKLKIIEDESSVKVTRNNNLQKLFHEVIQNNYLCDLITFQSKQNKKEEKQFYNNIKKQMNYNEKDENDIVS
ncbi:hypothetical protein RFI_15385 [Reticulomyxa filosa]|uniref:Uncharacterized protein n=1 Tax=Reticulomyxa filosa TaxID=46433 RepID=X6N7C9_RETFI|nr:hypothetical protein RFI_15385 [Reticulomyxa filosa]|eukprot:ETO21818.1 hypothetical protein RFI_15385 [Reticulomyxa filosa]